MEYQANRAILVGLCTDDRLALQIESSLDELERLLETAGGTCFAKVVQNKDKPDPRTLIGSGKVRELSALCSLNAIELVVFDEELAPSQIRNLEDALGDDVRVIDRSILILDIFALHAVSREGKLQVELAQLKYTAPRLTGHGQDMSRLGGGIGTDHGAGMGDDLTKVILTHGEIATLSLAVALPQERKGDLIFVGGAAKSGDLADGHTLVFGMGRILRNQSKAQIFVHVVQTPFLDGFTKAFVIEQRNHVGRSFWM